MSEQRSNPLQPLLLGAAIEAAESGDVARLRQLAGQGALLNQFDSEGRSPLLLAVGREHKAAVKVLIELGADPNLQNPEGFSPLALAVAGEDVELLKILLDGGGDPNGAFNDQPLTFLAAGAERWDNMNLLLDRGAKINATNALGETLLLRVANVSNFEQVFKLLGRDADPTMKSKTGGSVALRVQENPMPDTSPMKPWRDKVKAELQRRGVRFPVTKPSESKD